MANNIYIWSTDSSLWESSGADIIYLATTPGANGDAGGQSKNIVGNNQTLQSTPLKDALLDIGSDNLVTLAGNYTGADGRTPYNLNYTAKLTLKEISGVRFSTGGELNFSSQTGGPHTTADDGSALNDRNIKVNVVADNDAFVQGSSTAFGTTQNLSTNGFLSLAGTLTVTGDASANINVASRGNIAGLTNDDGGWVNNASSNILNASAYKAENFYITNNFTGTLTADAELRATSTVGATANSNTVQAHGVWGISSVRSDGYWGKKLDDGSYYGTIVATANGSVIRASVDDLKPNEDGSTPDSAATATGNIIGAYGIRSGSDDPNNYSGSITLDSHNGLNGYYGYNGSISVSASNNKFVLKAQGKDVALTFTGNSVKAVGIASNSLTVNGMFLGEISATVENTSFNLSGGNSQKWSVTNNDVLAAGIYTSTLVGNNTFAGNIQVTNTDFYLSARGPSKDYTFARAYGIYASDITINGSQSGGTAGSLGYASGLLASNITVTTSISSGVGGLSAAVGIKADTLTAEAFTGTITVDSGLSAVRNVGLDVSSFANGNDSIFDMAGSITVNEGVKGVYPVIAGIMTQDAINMRISGDITVPVISTGKRDNVFAIYAGDISGSYIPSGENDNLTIAAGAVIQGDIDLTTGTNYITVDSNASIKGDLLATNGNLNLTILLNKYGSVGGENIATGDTAIIQSQGKMKGTAVTGLTINLNNAEVGKTYKIIEGVDWGQGGVPKEIGFLYNNTSAERKNVVVGSHIEGTLTGGGFTITYETWIENGALYVQVTGGTPTSAIDSITGFQGQVSDVPGQYQTVTFSWDEPTTYLATNAEYEFEYRIGTLTESGDYEWTNSIVVMLNNSARSYNVYNIQDNQIVQARLRVNQSSGAYYSDWTSAEQVGGADAQIPLVVGKVEDGNTYFLDGNTQGATSTTMDFGWEDVAADCTKGLQYYEMQYFVAKEDIAKEDWAELWAWLEANDSTYSKEWGVNGTVVTLSNEHTYTIFEHTSKTTTINHMLVSRMNDGQYVYWRVQAVDNENNPGGWTDGERFLVENRDTESPILNDPDPSMVKEGYPVYHPDWDPVTQTASSTVDISLQWTYNATDDVSGVNKYTWHYRLKGSNDEYKSISFSVNGYQFGGTMTEVISGLAPGIYEAYLTVFDNVLKESSTSAPMEWVLDVTGPTINITENPSTTTINLDGYKICGEPFVNVDQETINPGDMIDGDGRKVTTLLQNVSITIDVADIVDSDSGLYYFKLCYEVVADASTGATTWKYLSSKEVVSGMTDWTVDVDLNVADSYNWMFVAYDKAGNASEYYFTSGGDSTPPVFVTDPTYDYTMNPSDSSQAAYTLRWDAAVDNGSAVNTGVAYYRIIFDSKLELDDVVIVAKPEQSTYSYDLKDSDGNWIWLPVDVSYQIRIEAYDWLYNVMPSATEQKKHMASSVINIIPDNDPPVFNPTMNYHVRYSVVNGTLTQNVDLTWTSAEDSGSGVKGYWVMYRKQGESEWSEPVWANHSKGTSRLTLTGLADGNYEWQIYAVDKRGNESPVVSSSWQNDTEAPTFAEDAAGTHGDVVFVGGDLAAGTFAQVQVTISWSAAADAQQTVGTDNLVDPSGIQGYIVEYRYKLPEDADYGIWYSVNSKDNLITGTTYTLNPDNLPLNFGNADYQWRIQAVDWSGNVSGYLEGDSVEGWTGDVTAPVFDATNLGSVVVVFDNGSLNATVSWTPGSDEYSGLYGYKLYYRVKDTTFDWTAANDGNFIAYDKSLRLYTYQITGLTPANGSYEWLVVAYDRVGNMTDEAAIGTFDGDLNPPVLNGDITAQIVEYVGNPGEDWKQNVTISWSPADDAAVEGAASSGVEYYTLQFKLTSDPESAYNKYSFNLYLDADPADPNRYVLKDANSPYVSLYEDFGILLDNNDYTVRILATDKAGNTTAVADGLTAEWVGDHEAPVFAVENITGTEVEYVISNGAAFQNVTITWNPADDGTGSGVRGYTIRYKLDDESVKDWSVVSDLITGTSYSISNLAHGNYVFEITAIDNVGNETVVSSGWTGDVTAPFFPKTDASVTVDDNNNVVINWKAAAKEDSSVKPQSGVKEYVFTLHREGDDAEKTYTVVVDNPDLSSYVFTSSFWDSYLDGTYTWSLVAVDYAGNQSVALTGDSFLIDRDAPHGPNGTEGQFTQLPAPSISVEYDYFLQPGIEGPEDAVEVRDPASITVTFDASNHTYEDPTGVYFIYQISLDQTFQDASKLVYNTQTEKEYLNTTVYEGDSLVLSTENNGITRLAGYAPGTTFYWRVKAVDGRGHEVSNWSQQVTPFQLKDSSGEYDIDIVDIYTNPTTPENVSVTEYVNSASEYTHRITWIPSTDAFGIQGYNIEISNKMETGYIYLPADDISYNDLYVGGAYLTLNSGTYYFRVQAVDGSGRTSAWSEKVSYTVSEDVYTGDGSSSDVAFVLDNAAQGSNYYVTSATGELGLATATKLNGVWYKFDLLNEGKQDVYGRPLGGILNLSLTGVTSKVTVTICDDITKKTIKKFTVKSGSRGVSDIIIDPAKYGDRIYVYVTGDKNTTRAQYTINGTITFFESPDYDELKTNPKSLALTSTDGSASGSVSDWVGYQDKGDYYMVTGKAAATIQSVNITGVTGKLKVTLYDNDWKKKASVTITQDAYGLFSGQLIPEVYFIAVETTDRGKGKVNSYYNLSVTEDYLPADKPSSNPGNVVALDANGYVASTDEWVGYGDAVDYYNFSTAHAGALNVSINVKQSATLKVTLYRFVDGKQKKLKSVTVKSTTNNTNLFKDYLVPVGNFMITVESGDKGKGKQNSYYDLVVSDQYKHPASSNSSYATADQGTLIVNQKTTAANDLWVGYGDPVDYYEVNVAGDGVFNLGVYDLTAKVKVFVYEKKADGVAGKKIASATLNAGTNTDAAFKKEMLLDAGSYYVVVESGDKKTAKQETSYNLNFNGTYFVNDSHVNDNSVWDADTVAQTQTLAANETIQLSGWVGYNDASDFFRFNVSGSSAVKLDFSNFNSSNLKYEVRSVDTNKKVSFDKEGVSKDLLSGAYYVEISTKNEKKYYSNDFTLGITSI